MAFYNPRSKSRPHQFTRVLEILREECEPERLVLFARAVSRPDEAIACVSLSEATPEMADMQTVVIVGGGLSGLVCALQVRKLCPQASVLVTGVEDPDTRAHGANEGLHLAEWEKVLLAETLLLRNLGQR